MKLVVVSCAVIGSVFLLLRLFFHFSYEETPYAEVYIQEVAPNSYELTFRYQARVSGNMHGPSLPFGSSTHDRAKWFYVKSNAGEVAAADVVLTNYRGCKDPLYWQKEMTGTVNLSANTVTFSLEMPRYDTPDGNTSNTVQRHVTWKHNGEYTLLSSAPPSLETTVSDYRPPSCDNYSSMMQGINIIMGLQNHQRRQ